MIQLFGGDRQDMTEQGRHSRRQFVLRVLIPLALSILYRSENSDRDPQHAGDVLRVGDVLRLASDETGWQMGRLFDYADRVARS